MILTVLCPDLKKLFSRNQELEMQRRFRGFVAENGGVFGLYTGIFFQAIYGGVWTVSLPYIIKALGGSDSAVGIYMGLAFSGYFFSLLLSFIYRNKIETINLKSIVMFGTAFLAVIASLTSLIVILAEKGICKNPIPFLFILVICQGMNTCCLWPRFVGWISACHEGKMLNHRLGMYNLCWATAGMIGPFVGGHLVQHSLTMPLLANMIVAAISFVCVCFANRPQQRVGLQAIEPKITERKAEKLRVQFMLSCRVLLFVSMICIGTIRTQLPLLFKFTLGFSESEYGTAFTIMSITTFIIFMITGRTHRWHYKLSLVFIANLMIGLCMLLIILGRTLPLHWIAMALAGIVYAFLYASHLYYIISGAKQRATKMVIHEITLCLGTIVGSFAGGFLSDHFGRYNPYYFGLIVMTLGMVAVIIVLVKYRRT